MTSSTLRPYHKFNAKIDTHCRICGCDLMSGTEVWGKKDTQTGWVIICPCCYDQLPDAQKSTTGIKESSPIKPDVQTPDSKQAEDQMLKSNKALEDIKVNAPWGINTEEE
jgi:hypothetical protein